MIYTNYESFDNFNDDFNVDNQKHDYLHNKEYDSYILKLKELCNTDEQIDIQQICYDIKNKINVNYFYWDILADIDNDNIISYENYCKVFNLLFELGYTIKNRFTAYKLLYMTIHNDKTNLMLNTIIEYIKQANIIIFRDEDIDFEFELGYKLNDILHRAIFRTEYIYIFEYNFIKYKDDADLILNTNIKNINKIMLKKYKRVIYNIEDVFKNSCVYDDFILQIKKLNMKNKIDFNHDIFEKVITLIFKNSHNMF